MIADTTARAGHAGCPLVRMQMVEIRWGDGNVVHAPAAVPAIGSSERPRTARRALSYAGRAEVIDR